MAADVQGTIAEHQVVEDFVDDRLQQLWRQVWRALPSADVARVYAMLGEGVLQVIDHRPENRPTRGFGHIERVGAGVRLFADYYNLDDANDAQARYIFAHELSHLLLGHLGPAVANKFELSPAAQLKVLAAVATANNGSYLPAADVDHEAEADAQAAAWGFIAPAAWRRRGPRATVTEWTTQR